MLTIKSNRSPMNGLEYFLIVSLLIVLFQPLALPFPLRGEELDEGQIEVQLKKETPLREEVNPVRNSGRYDSKPRGASNPAGIILGPNPAIDGTAEQRDIISNGVNIEERWGIQILSIRLSASDYMLDFRYRVIDPEKAHMFTQKEIKPYLIDQATGKKLPVARTRLGPMRQTAVKPVSGRNYAILFGNTNKVVKEGNKVTIVIGDFKAENLTVE